MSTDANNWAKYVDAPCSTSKQVLRELADFASVDGRAYPLVSSIARVTQKSDRTVIRMLNKLEAAGLIQHESWITPPGSDFRRPVYRLAMPDVPAFSPDPDLRRRGGDQTKRKMAATVKGVVDVTCKGAADVTCEGVVDVTCEGDTLSPKTVYLNSSEAIASSVGAGARPNGVREIVAAVWTVWPEFGRLTSSRKLLRRAVEAELGSGADPAALIAAASAYAADKSAWGASGKPKAVHAFYAEGRWENFTNRGVGPSAGLGGGGAVTAWAGPGEVFAAAAAVLGCGVATSCLAKAGWRAEGGVILARTDYAATRLNNRKCREALESVGVGGVILERAAA